MNANSLFFWASPRRFATFGSLFAAAAGASLSPVAQIPRMAKYTGFLHGYFAQGVSYASFGAWKSSFAK